MKNVSQFVLDYVLCIKVDFINGLLEKTTYNKVVDNV